MREPELRALLRQVQQNKLSVEQALVSLHRARGFIELAGAKPEPERSARTGIPEVVYCPGKPAEQVARIMEQLARSESLVLASRATPEYFQVVRRALPQAVYHQQARLISLGRSRERSCTARAALSS